MLKCIVNFSYSKYLKLSKLDRTGVTKVSEMKSRAKFLLIAFSLVLIGIFQLFGTTVNVHIIQHIGSFKTLPMISG